MKKILISGILTFTVFLIISCGGSSSSNSARTIDNNETNETNQTSIIQGTVYDDIIVNLPYSTKNYDDYTNEDGKFNYDSGEVRFYLGTMLLGSVPAMPEDKKVFISDMLNLPRGTVDNKKLIKLARILQSLDTTPQSDNKIVLSKNQTSQIFSTPNQTLDNFDINSLANHAISIITEDEAKQRIANTYEREDITIMPANKPPIVEAGDDIVANENQSITFNANASDPDGNITRYEWFEGTKSLHVGKTYTTNSLSVGTHTIILKVTDNMGDTSSDSLSVTIEQFQILSISPQNNDKNVLQNANITIRFNAPIKNANQTTLQLKNSTDNTDVTPLNISIQDNNQTLIITNTLSSFTKTYILTIKKEITNNFGASLAQDTNITFYTKDIASPTIKSIKTDDLSKITITFSENIKTSTLIKSNFTLTPNDTSFDINSTNNPTIVLDLNKTLDFAKEYSLMLKNLTDNESTPLTQTTKTFTTQNSRVLQTGQTFCTNSSNNVIDCSNDAAKGQDGWYALKALGKQRSYTRDNENNITTDLTMGLEWEDNATVHKTWIDMGSGTADNYCKTLNLDGTNWTLPTIQQLKSIVDYNVTGPSINETYFKKSNFRFYWSSTLFDSGSAWNVYFNDGNGRWRDVGMPNVVRCVRPRL